MWWGRDTSSQRRLFFPHAPPAHFARAPALRPHAVTHLVHTGRVGQAGEDDDASILLPLQPVRIQGQCGSTVELDDDPAARAVGHFHPTLLAPHHHHVQPRLQRGLVGAPRLGVVQQCAGRASLPILLGRQTHSQRRRRERAQQRAEVSNGTGDSGGGDHLVQKNAHKHARVHRHEHPRKLAGTKSNWNGPSRTCVLPGHVQVVDRHGPRAALPQRAAAAEGGARGEVVYYRQRNTSQASPLSAIVLTRVSSVSTHFRISKRGGKRQKKRRRSPSFWALCVLLVA